jgi:hypothetical protein
MPTGQATVDRQLSPMRWLGCCKERNPNNAMSLAVLTARRDLIHRSSVLFARRVTRGTAKAWRCMEMDTPEQQSKESAKRRVRLASPRKQLERTIQKMTKLSETAETAMKPEKFVDLMTTLAGLQVKLLELFRDAKEVEHEALTDENERLKSELAARPTDEDIQVKLMLAELKRSDSGLLQQLKGEVETLKSQIAKLQAENTELSTNNSALTSTNCELTEKMQRLLLEKAELQLTITKLETRTPQELLAEASARFKATSLKDS